MNTESTREYCISLPHATENVQWGADLCFKIGAKMFAVTSLEPARVVLAFKATPEKFYELQEMEGIIPAPYMARAQWLALERWDVLRDQELRDLLQTSYDLVFGKLTRKQQEEVRAGKKVVATKSRKKAAGTRAKKAAKKTPAKKAATKKAATKKPEVKKAAKKKRSRN